MNNRSHATAQWYLCNALILAIFCCDVGELLATTVLETDLETMLQRSDLVFQGQVINVESRWNESRNRIYTHVTFVIQEVIKGEYPQDRIELIFAGGTVGDISLQIADMHYPEPGEEGIYFVESLSSRQVHPFYGWSQGHLLIQQDAGGRKKVLTHSRQPVRGLAPTPARHSGRISQGVAAGLIMSDKPDLQDAMGVPEFKDGLRQMLP